MSQFFQHWTDLNAALGSALVLSDTRNVALLGTWLDDVETKIAATAAAVVAAENRKGELDVLKEGLIAWTVVFNATVRANHGDSTYVRNLAAAPQQSAGRGQFVDPALRTQQIWGDLNDSLTADVELKRRRTLPNGTIQTDTLTVSQYGDLITALQEKWNEWTRAQQKADNVREERNDVMALAYETMKDYRQRVPLELPADHALLASLPALSPDPAKKPAAPVGSGVWNAATEKADMTAVASTSASVERHELRYSPEDPYDTENEVTLAVFALGTALEFSTGLGLALAGDTSRFTWVAVTGDGHEGRSEVVAVTRT